MNCYKCSRSVQEGFTLHRQNPKGEAGIFACEYHNEKPVDPEVRELVDIINPPKEITDANQHS